MNFTIKLLTFITITLLFFNACKKGENEFYHYETSCSDPWGRANSNTQTEINLRDYLEEEGIQVVEVWFEQTVGQDCLACDCATGNIIIIKTNKEYTKKMLELGFQEN